MNTRPRPPSTKYGHATTAMREDEPAPLSYMCGVCTPRKQARGKAGDKGGGKAGDRGGGKAGKGSNQKARGSAARGGGKGSKLSKSLTKEEASITGAIVL